MNIRKAIARFCMLATAGTFLVSGSLTAQAAETYPDKPITLIVPYAPGGSTDILGRLIGDRLSRHFDQNVIIENRAGADGTLGVVQTRRQKPDGYNLTMLPLTVLRQPHLIDVAYDPIEDITWISSMTNYNYAIAVPWDSPWETIEDLITAVRENPGKYDYAGSSPYSSNNLAMVEFAREADLDWQYIAFKGDIDGLNALMGNHVDIVSSTVTSLMPFVESERLRPLVVAGPQRSPDLPDVPTLKEKGYEVGLTSPLGLGGPANMDPEVVAIIDGAIQEALEDPAFIEQAQKQGWTELLYMNHEDYSKWAAETFENEKSIIERLSDQQ